MTDRLRPLLRRLCLECERGAAAIEFALLVSLFVLAMIEGVMALGGSSVDLWDGVDQQASAAMGAAQDSGQSGTPANGKKPKKPKKPKTPK
jgi:Flp pilus assembly pilin Flp